MLTVLKTAAIVVGLVWLIIALIVGVLYLIYVLLQILNNF